METIMILIMKVDNCERCIGLMIVNGMKQYNNNCEHNHSLITTDCDNHDMMIIW